MGIAHLPVGAYLLLLFSDMLQMNTAGKQAAILLNCKIPKVFKPLHKVTHFVGMNSFKLHHTAPKKVSKDNIET